MGKIDQVQSSLVNFSSIPTRNKGMLKFLQFYKIFKTNKQQFDKAVKTYIVFSDVNSFECFFLELRLKFVISSFSQDPKKDPMTLVNKSNDSPYIIAVLSADKKKFKCYIDVNKLLVSVSFHRIDWPKPTLEFVINLFNSFIRQIV